MKRSRVQLTTVQREWIRRRDNFTCQECAKKGGYFEVHHIIPYSVAVYDLGWTPERANAPENLILLCKSCHTATHGKKWNKNKENRFAVYAFRITLKFVKGGLK